MGFRERPCGLRQPSRGLALTVRGTVTSQLPTGRDGTEWGPARPAARAGVERPGPSPAAQTVRFGAEQDRARDRHGQRVAGHAAGGWGGWRGTNLLRDRVCGRSDSGTIHGGGARSGEGRRLKSTVRVWESAARGACGEARRQDGWQGLCGWFWRRGRAAWAGGSAWG